MEHTVFTREFPLPPPQEADVLRYALAPGGTEALDSVFQEIRQQMEPALTSRVCWTELPIPAQNLPIPGFSATDSDLLRQALPGCEAVVVFAATVGMGPDRLIARYGRISPVRALMAQALGTERIEALCDCFCDEIRRQAAQKKRHTLPRFSPGYGALPLSLQQDIFRLLDCPKRMGLTLNDSLLMTPGKSITAFIGIRSCAAPVLSGKCESCRDTDCPFRRSL